MRSIGSRPGNYLNLQFFCDRADNPRMKFRSTTGLMNHSVRDPFTFSDNVADVIKAVPLGSLHEECQCTHVELSGG
jgi:hypothetical protein